VLTLGFGMAVTMWAAAYVCRLPAVMAPGWFLLGSMLAAAAAWGAAAGRLGAGGLRRALAAGALAGTVNLLILGSLLSSTEPGRVIPSALWWVPGSIVVVALAAAAGAGLGSLRARGAGAEPEWTGLLARVAVAATFLLVVAGGLVTSAEAGLAVVDWPNSFGYNMFLYPLARMTGGIYYEHAHRLFGSLVGLTTVVLAVQVWRVEARAWVRRLALAATVVVVVQGILGGLRVTGRFTLTTSPDEVAPNLALALVHGVLGQVFLGMMVVLAAAASRTWKLEQPPAPRPEGAGSDRYLHLTLVGALLVQLVLGALQRHFAQGLLVHIGLAVVVSLLAALAGSRAWGLDVGRPVLQSLGKGLVVLLGLQLLLGIAALAVTGAKAVVGAPGVLAVTLATAHQACGAALLAVSVALAAWGRRLLQPPA
jgi:cytochrome c oxidase assembly protein subunit 15